jgi:IS5 family transposase
MKPKTPSHEKQGHLLYPDLVNQLDPKDPLLLLAKQIPWERFEQDFTPLYSSVGRAAKPVRLMIGLLLLKQIENLSDEKIVEAWVRNPYYQAFCGIEIFQWNMPCDPSDLVHFRKRIGEAGVEKIFQASVALHGEKSLEREVVIDTTVQEKNITFPTDTKLRVKVMARCWKLAAQEGLHLRRSYRRELEVLPKNWTDVIATQPTEESIYVQEKKSCSGIQSQGGACRSFWRENHCRTLFRVRCTPDPHP